MACSIRTNRHGFLALNLIWSGCRSWEGTGLRDTAENRRRLKRVADLVTAEIKAGVFNAERYLHFFPQGNRRSESKPAVVVPVKPAITIRQYYDSWIKQQKPPLVRVSRERDYRQSITTYVLNAVVKIEPEGERILGEVPVGELKPRILVDLRQGLLDSGLNPKTVRNIIDSSFRAMIRSARTVDYLIEIDPFAALQWDRAKKAKPDPFSESERDLLLEWYLENQPFYFPFIYALFFTGMRPSELVALRVANVDADRGLVEIQTSRYLGSEAPTKTEHSERTINLLADVRTVFQTLVRHKKDRNQCVFVNAKNGGRINHSEWPKGSWKKALKETDVRPRKFYATRHTFIGTALTKGLNIKFIAEYCGTSVTMIEQRYGRFLSHRAEDQLRMLESEPSPDSNIASAKGETSDQRFHLGAEQPLWNKVSPTGFESVVTRFQRVAEELELSRVSR